MLTITGLRSLDQFGIVPLTGEADALSFRILCDLTARGAAIFRETYGLPANSPLAGNWNSRGIASVLIPPWAWQELGIIALVRDGAHTVIAVESNDDEHRCIGLFGLYRDESLVQGEWNWDSDNPDSKPVKLSPDMLTADGNKPMEWPTCYGKIGRVFRLGNNPRQGTRNVHAMSGRVE